MLYSKIVTGMDEDIFSGKLDLAIKEETLSGGKLNDIYFSTCAAALAPCVATADADIYSVTRYTALLIFCRKDF